MKKLHKLLYSLFGFFVCGFGATGADAAIKCGKLVQRSDGNGTDLETAEWTWHLYKDGAPSEVNTTLGVCVNNQCITVSSDKFNAACITYSAVKMLSLYEAVVSGYGCTQNFAYSSTGCTPNDDCQGGFSACNTNYHHVATCAAGCKAGYFYDSASRTCKLCPSYSTKTGNTIDTKYGTTTSCNTTTYATATKCYITNVSNGYDKATGDSYRISSDDMCMYQS